MVQEAPVASVEWQTLVELERRGGPAHRAERLAFYDCAKSGETPAGSYAELSPCLRELARTVREAGLRAMPVLGIAIVSASRAQYEEEDQEDSTSDAKLSQGDGRRLRVGRARALEIKRTVSPKDWWFVWSRMRVVVLLGPYPDSPDETGSVDRTISLGGLASARGRHKRPFEARLILMHHLTSGLGLSDSAAAYTVSEIERVFLGVEPSDPEAIRVWWTGEKKGVGGKKKGLG